MKVTDQAGESETFRYDSEGNQISHVDRNGTRISMDYNMYGSLVRRTAIKAEAGGGSTEKGGRSTERKDPGSTSESFFYFPDGRLKTAIAGGMRYEYTYDVSGRLKSKSASGRELISYGYDLNGNKTSQRDVTGNVTEYRYGISDELLEVYDKGVLRASYEYNPDGTVKRQKTGNGTEILTDTCYAYDEDRNLTGLKTFIPGGWQNDYRTEPVQLVCNAYGYDRNGNRMFKETMGGRTEYEYDSRNRLEMVRYPDRWEKFGYDLAGNRKSRVTGEGEERYTYDVRNRLVQVVRTAGNGAPMMAERHPAGTVENGYGTARAVEDGYRTVKAGDEVWKYEYDRQGNLLKDNHAEYSYDRFNRMEKAETFTGKIQVNHYDAFGNLIKVQEEVNNRFLYVGQQYDAVTMQYYLRARYYNPVVARFTQEDTYRGDGLNLYAYCWNNPVGYYDPSGHDTCGDSKSGKKIITTNLGNEIDITPSSNHTSVNKNPGPYTEHPNSSVDIVDKDGNIITRRWYDSEKKAYRDVDFTDHGNPKQHPEVPHEHTWDYNNGKPDRN